MDVKNRFIQHLRSVYPSLAANSLQDLISDNLLSPFHVELPATLLMKIQNAIKLCSDLRDNPYYQKALHERLKSYGYDDRDQRSIMMSYDFHIDESGSLRLIEINTNASFLILGDQFYKTENLKPSAPNDPLADLKSAILEELGNKTKNPRIAIIDDTPDQQRLYVEFLVARAVFESWGWQTEILDSKQVNPADFDFIYNRDTDFFLQNSAHQKLRAAAIDNQTILSPHPVEYFYLADKQRLIDWSNPDFRKQVANHPWEKMDEFLIPSRLLTAENREMLWSERKKLFFKPLHAFGAKSSFKAASMSRRTFDELQAGDTIAQEYVHAPVKTFSHDGQQLEMKFDLRCYAYRDRLQLVVARLYQGQVTNLRTPLGGFACVEFK